ncbi:TonB-dependent receptor, partial [Escherichia coli]|nr:TonB-dependent receptor [Escherichia coli]
AKTMIPLDLGNYGGGLKINTADSQGPNPTNPTAAPLGVRQVTSANASGNPYLNPWRSNNYDISLEYYLGRASMLNIG